MLGRWIGRSCLCAAAAAACLARRPAATAADETGQDRGASRTRWRPRRPAPTAGLPRPATRRCSPTTASAPGPPAGRRSSTPTRPFTAWGRRASSRSSPPGREFGAAQHRHRPALLRHPDPQGLREGADPHRDRRHQGDRVRRGRRPGRDDDDHDDRGNGRGLEPLRLDHRRPRGAGGDGAPGSAPQKRIVVHPRDAVAWALHYPEVVGGADAARLAGMGSAGQGLARAATLLSQGQVEEARPRWSKPGGATRSPWPLASIIAVARKRTGGCTPAGG
jgi:hypothetical protein